VIAAEDFFLEYRRTARAADELIVAVELPRRAGLWTGSTKVAKRQTDDISIVAAAFALGIGPDARVTHARLAYGGVAAIPRRATRSEAFLLGRALDEDTLAQVAALLRVEFEPISDHRAGGDYRRALCANLFLRFVAGPQP
jgi:xanthine dehydrogenase iron-sulfur cluster and FAD-binding subunit A